MVPLTAMEEKFNFMKMSGQYFLSFMKLALRLQLLLGTAYVKSLLVLSGAHEEKERISHIHTVVISKNKVKLADSHSC